MAYSNQDHYDNDNNNNDDNNNKVKDRGQYRWVAGHGIATRIIMTIMRIIIFMIIIIMIII